MNLLSYILTFVLLANLVVVGSSQALEPFSEFEVITKDEQFRRKAESFFRKNLTDPITDADLSAAIKSFYLRWPVQMLKVERITTDEKRVFRFHISTSPSVEDIEIIGRTPFSEDDLLPQLTFRVGDQAFPSSMRESEERLTNYLVLRGYPRASVSLELENPDATETKLKVNIKAGAACRIHSVSIRVTSGPFTAKKLQQKMRLRAGNRCDLKRIQDEFKTVADYLRDQGYPAATYKGPELELTEDGKLGEVRFEVDSGYRIDVRFFGNTFLFERSSILKDRIFMDRETQFNQAWIELSKKQITEFYHELGFSKVETGYTEEVDDVAKVRRINFFIRRGLKTRISDLYFVGNQKISSETLEQEAWASAPEATYGRAFVYNELLEIADALVAYYQSRGFLRVVIQNPKIQRVSEAEVNVGFEIDEGVPSTISSIVFRGNDNFSSDELKEIFQVQENSPVAPLPLEEAKKRLEDFYRSRGYKFATIDLPKLDTIPPGSLEYLVQIEEGPRVRFGDIVIRGNSTTEEKVIRRELTFERSEFYDPTKIERSRRKLVQLGFFRSVRLEELGFDERTGTEDIAIVVLERKKRSIAFRPGFSTEEGVRVESTLTYRNIAGSGRSASVGGRVNQQIQNPGILEHRAIFTYHEPYIFNLVDGRLNYIDERREEQGFDLSRRTFVTALDKEVTEWFRTTLQYQIEFRRPFNIDAGVVLSPFDQESARFGYVTSLLNFDFRDDFLNPMKGSFHEVKLDLYDDVLFSQADFSQVFVRNNFYLPIYKKLRLAFSVRAGFSATDGRTAAQGIVRVPIEKRFRLGGSSSLRGFGRNCVGGLPDDTPENCSAEDLSQAPGGNSVFNYMADLVIPLVAGFELAVFTDGGQAYLSNRDFNPFDIRMSYGAGIRYNTFFGPMRLDYGIKLDRRTGESFGAIHFAVGYF